MEMGKNLLLLHLPEWYIVTILLLKAAQETIRL
jgi:hypothetical protein